MTQREAIEQLRQVFAEVEKTAAHFGITVFFHRPPNGKWSAAENVQHLFLSLKPLVGLFGKPELMLQQWGASNRPSRTYDQVVAEYLKIIGNGGQTTKEYVPTGMCATEVEQIGQLHSIHQKFIERTSQLSETDLDTYQVPHPLIGLLTAREFLYFTHYHTKRHNDTLAGLLKG